MMWDGWWWAFGGVPMILLWVGIIVLIAWVVMKIVRSSSTESKSDAMDIAKARYAKGEISKEEFDQIKKDIA
ncbi:MAG: SHOCT domain-containing protein [Dehalococcoidia bacterium]|nr:MAG: SHOCT domain-containing protein [Dehalococcoidia bacterium]